MTIDRNDEDPAVTTTTAVAATAAITSTAATRPALNRPMSSVSFASAAMGKMPGNPRERLRSLARATQQAIKQELNKFYDPPSPEDADTRLRDEFSKVSAPGKDQKPALPPRPTMSTSETTHSSSSSSGQDNDVPEPSTPIDPTKPYCMLFPTYAYRTEEGNKWKTRLEGWTYALPGSGRLERWLVAAGRSYGGLLANSTQDTHFIRLLNQFRCQTLRSIELKLSIVDVVAAEHILSRPLPAPSDSHSETRDHTRFHDKLRDATHNMIEALTVNSGESGRFEEELTLDLAHLLDKAHHKMLRLVASFDTIAEATPHDGFVDLIEPEGISIISDIDDTIKITNVLDGRDAIVQNTFFKQSDQVEGMSEVYRQWADQGVHVHYVSNSPWQVYPNLGDFIQDKQFPPGSMHLRSISATELITTKVSQHKIEVIPQILKDFPNRKFILIGDSGERDPEVYREVYDRYPHQIIKILIHDVSSERARSADQRDESRSDSFYNSFRKYVSRELSSGTPPHTPGAVGGSSYFRPQRTGTSASVLMDALGEADVPEEEKAIEDPTVPLKTKLDLFNERMVTVSEGLPSGVFSLFSKGSELLTEPVVAAAICDHRSRRQAEP